MPRGTRQDRRAARPPLPPGFGAIWSCVALDLVGFGIVLPILPIYAERFRASPGVIGLLVASFSVAQLVLAPVWGRLSDRIGRKPILILSLAGTAVGSLVTGLAGGVAMLFVGRLIDGASGASVSVAQAAVTDVAGRDQRARLLGLLGAAFGVGFVGGPALGALAALGGRRLPFVLAAVIAGLNALWAVRRLPETHPDHSRTEFSFAGLPEGFGPGLDEPYGPGLDDMTDDGPAGRALPPAAGGPVADRERVGDGARRGLAPLVAVAFLSLMAFSGFEATFALFGERRLGLHLASTGAVFAAVGVVHSLVQVGLVHPAVDRFGEAGALRVGLALHAGGLVLLAAAHGFLLAGPALALITAGQGLVTPTMAASVAHRVGDGERGAALGVQQSAGGLGRVAGPVLAGFLFQRAGVPVPYLVGAALVVAATLAA